VYTYDTIEEFNVDPKAEYSALSSTRSRKKIKKKLKQTNASVRLIQYRLRSVKSGIRVTMEERIGDRDSAQSTVHLDI